MDADHVGDLASAVDAARTLQALGSPLAQAGDELAPQLALRVGVDGVVDRLVGHVSAGIGGIGSLERSGGLLGRPLPCQHLAHGTPQHAVWRQRCRRTGCGASTAAQPGRRSGRRLPGRCGQAPASSSRARGSACGPWPAGSPSRISRSRCACARRVEAVGTSFLSFTAPYRMARCCISDLRPQGLLEVIGQRKRGIARTHCVERAKLRRAE